VYAMKVASLKRAFIASGIIRSFFALRHAILYFSVAGWSSLVARWAHNPKVVGSNPAPATKFHGHRPSKFQKSHSSFEWLFCFY
jgi:hypothetical protein